MGVLARGPDFLTIDCLKDQFIVSDIPKLSEELELMLYNHDTCACNQEVLSQKRFRQTKEQPMFKFEDF